MWHQKHKDINIYGSTKADYVNLCAVKNEMGGNGYLVFDLNSLRAATNSFSEANKLGEGGYGPVYMVILQLRNSCFCS